MDMIKFKFKIRKKEYVVIDGEKLTDWLMDVAAIQYGIQDLADHLLEHSEETPEWAKEKMLKWCSEHMDETYDHIQEFIKEI